VLGRELPALDRKLWRQTHLASGLRLVKVDCLRESEGLGVGYF
jgi:hypothetical protein